MGFSDPKELICPVRPIGYHNLRLRSRKSNSTWVDPEGNRHHIAYCILCYEHYDSIIKISTDKKGKTLVEREFVSLTAEEVNRLLKKQSIYFKKLEAEKQVDKSSEKPIES